MIEVLLADDQELVRAGLRVLVEHDGDISVVGEAENGREAVALARELRPDLVLMDLSMPVMGGVEATRAIVEDPGPGGTRVLVLTTFDDDEEVFAAIRSGAAGYLLKDLSLLDPSVTARVMQAAIPSTAAAELPAGLSEREVEVLVLVGRGLSNEEIAGELYLSPATARTYVSRLFAKLGARDRAALIVLAYETGLVRPGRSAAD
jgi:DNA-binding NarL/FixJ family response regulator